MPDVFVSYNSKDVDAARAVVAKLKEKGLDVWFDKKELKPGDSVTDRLETAIRDSKTFVALLGKSSATLSLSRIRQDQFLCAAPPMLSTIRTCQSSR